MYHIVWILVTPSTSYFPTSVIPLCGQNYSEVKTHSHLGNHKLSQWLIFPEKKFWDEIQYFNSVQVDARRVTYYNTTEVSSPAGNNNFMKHSWYWEANSCLTSQDISCLYEIRRLKPCCNSPPLHPSVDSEEPKPHPPSLFLENHFSINTSSTPRSSGYFLCFSLRKHNFLRISHFACALHAPPILQFFIWSLQQPVFKDPSSLFLS